MSLPFFFATLNDLKLSETLTFFVKVHFLGKCHRCFLAWNFLLFPLHFPIRQVSDNKRGSCSCFTTNNCSFCIPLVQIGTIVCLLVVTIANSLGVEACQKHSHLAPKTVHKLDFQRTKESIDTLRFLESAYISSSIWVMEFSSQNGSCFGQVHHQILSLVPK